MGGDTNPALLNQYSGFDDPSERTPVSKPQVNPTATVTCTQAVYDAMVADGTVDPTKTYVITPTHAAE